MKTISRPYYLYKQYPTEKRQGMKRTEKKENERNETKRKKNQKPLTTYSSDNMDNTSKSTHTAILSRSPTRSHTNEYIRQFSKMRYAFQMFHFRRCCMFSCSLFSRLSDVPLFFSVGEKWSKHYLRFLDIRICYLRWDMRGMSFRFVSNIWNGAFVCIHHVIASNTRKASAAAAAASGHPECLIVTKWDWSWVEEE